jgi:hypothetical protein
MEPQVQRLYAKIEEQRRVLLAPLRSLSNEKLNAHRPGKWSINQIIAHLITVESLSIQYLNKKILGVNEVDDSRWKEEVKMLLLVISQRMPLKFKAPRVVVEQTSKETDFNKLVQEWDRTRLELKNLLDRIEAQHLKRKIYKHVHAGMLNIQHALKFLIEHVDHHTPQIKRLV